MRWANPNVSAPRWRSVYNVLWDHDKDLFCCYGISNHSVTENVYFLIAQTWWKQLESFCQLSPCKQKSWGCVSKCENSDIEIWASLTTRPPLPLYLVGAWRSSLTQKLTNCTCGCYKFYMGTNINVCRTMNFPELCWKCYTEDISLHLALQESQDQIEKY